MLDFGDKLVISDVSQRLLHGFTMWRWGKLVNVAPQNADVMVLLAEYYAAEGVLVFLEEPGWSGRRSLEDRLPGPPKVATSPVFLADSESSLTMDLGELEALQTDELLDPPGPDADMDTDTEELQDLPTEVVGLDDLSTEVLNIADIPDVGEFMDPATEAVAINHPVDLDTEVIDLHALKKAAEEE